jgi:sporulation protein YlmC with PRC-barrel domain
VAHREVHLELLLSKPVIDQAGQPIGRIEEVHVERLGDEWFVQEYLIGPAAILERLSAKPIGLKILHLLGARKLHTGYRVPWDKVDLTDPEKPRLLCNLHELKPVYNPM